MFLSTLSSYGFKLDWINSCQMISHRTERLTRFNLVSKLIRVNPPIQAEFKVPRIVFSHRTERLTRFNLISKLIRVNPPIQAEFNVL